MVRTTIVAAVISTCGLAATSFAAPLEGSGALDQDRAPGRRAIDARSIRLRAATIETGARRTLAESLGARRARAPRLVQLAGPMTAGRRAALERAGVRVGGYLGADAFLVTTTDATPESVAGLEFVRWADTVRPAWKLAPDLGRRSFATPERVALREGGRVLAHVTLVDGAEAAPVEAFLAGLDGAAVRASADEGGRMVLEVTLPEDQAGALAALDEVLFIEPAPEATLRNATVRWIVQTNVQNDTPVYANGITGEGQIVGVLDSKLDANHCSFYDPDDPIGPTHRKILAYNTTQSLQTHGTHVSGIVAGDNGDNSDTRGVAYGAKIVFDDIPSLSDSSSGTLLLPRFEQHRDQGARVHTNSWGDDGSTAYTGWCRAIDTFMWENEDNLVVFAETNQSTIRTPENAKNLLAVAATRDTPSQEQKGFGGVGPTTDGRRKPDIMAPGRPVMSAAAGQSCNVTSLSGTSMAAPGVAGTALLARQYFTDGFYPSGVAAGEDAFTPSAALLKATLLNSARDVTGISFGGDAYPNFSEGWGRVTLDDALYFPGDSRELLVFDVWNADGLSTGEDTAQSIAVESSGEQLRITMTFTDAPGALLASSPAVNDLDLEVTSPSGEVYRGNVFDAANGVSITGGSWDPINNVEQVHIDSPEVGEWSVRVIGRAVNVGSQGYAIAATGDFSDGLLTCIGDIDGDGVVGGADLGDLLGVWNQTRNAPFDLTGDSLIDGEDLGALLGAWGACP